MNRLLSSIPALMSMVGLVGCMTVMPPVTADYTGPRAALTDSLVPRGSGVDIFYLAQFNGTNTPDSLSATRFATAGKGTTLSTVTVKRDVPTMPATYTIAARTQYAAPVIAMVNDVYVVKGVVRFTPLAGGHYAVKGTLTKTYSALWIEDTDTGQIVTEKVEVKGDATIGLLEK